MDYDSEEEYTQQCSDSDTESRKSYKSESVKFIPKEPNETTNKNRSISLDSQTSDKSKKPNVRCGTCKKVFTLDKNQSMIRCIFCGYRILYKLRTVNYITYKSN